MAIDNDVPIAIIGMAYRAPGVGRSDMLEYLEQARSAWSEIPLSRFDASAYYKPGADKTGVFRAEGAHFVPDDIYAFDAGFFNMRAEEARNSDPQHRMLLECAFESAEDAGYSLTDLAGQNIGVYVGSGQHEYSQRLGDDPYAAKTWSATGVAPCMAANRISYFFGVHGPSITLDAACASSVYAIHQGVTALRNEECSAAFVASAALTLGPGGWLALEKTGALSVHGRSYSYDHKAAGFGRGEGAGCVLLKRLDQAIKDNDNIHAIIRASAVNHGGRSDGITMPNGVAHRALLRAVHERAGLKPADTPVVEGHGTGTAAGDPIEASAFTEVLAKGRTEANPIYIGSIKSNFGHLEGASGMLGLIKAVMMVKNGVVLPTAGFEGINPRIQDPEKVKVLDAPVPWPENEKRRVLVTNFGFGGSNSAIIVDEASTTDRNALNGVSENGEGRNGIVSNGDAHDGIGTNDFNKASKDANLNHLFVFSARTEKSLTAYQTSFEGYLDDLEEVNEDFLRDVSYTLTERRSHHAYRSFVVANSLDSLGEKLSTAKPTRIQSQTLGFAFTGQGAQYAQMAAGLWRFDEFAKAMADAEDHLTSIGASWSLREELSRPESDSRVNEAEISQPVCTAVQLALVTLLKTCGITPTLVTGHSSGEIAAAFSAGLVSFHTAVAVSYFRGVAAAKLLQQNGIKGSMLAIGVGADAANELIKQIATGYLTVAAVNSVNSVTVSGDLNAIDELHKLAESQGLFVRKLKVQMAYHSRHMEEIAPFYLDSIKKSCTEPSPRQSNPDEVFPGFISSVTGTLIESESVDAGYWIENLVQPVQFSNAMERFLANRASSGGGPSHSVDIVVEIGPHAALKTPIKSALELAQADRGKSPSSDAFTYLPSLIRGTSPDEALLNLLGGLHVKGCPIQIMQSISTQPPGKPAVVTGLPAYSWDKATAYNMEPRATHEKMYPGDPYHSLLGRRAQSMGGKDRMYRQSFTLDEFPWIRDHNVAGAVIFPMTGYISCAIEAARRTTKGRATSFLLRDIHVVARMEIQEEETVDMITKIRPTAIGEGAFSAHTWSFEISTCSEEGEWTVHAFGLVEPETAMMSLDTPTFMKSAPLVNTTDDLIEHDIAYTYDYAGVRATRYGPSFRNSVRFFEGDGYTVLEHQLRDLSAALQLPSPYGSHVTVDPPTLDGFLQGGGPLQKTEDGRRPAQMPNHINRFRVSNSIPHEPGQRFDIVTRLIDYDEKGGRMHIGVAVFARHADGSFTPVAELESATFRSIGSADEEIDPVAALPDNWTWHPLTRYDFLKPEQLVQKYKVRDLGESIEIRSADLDRAARYYIGHAMKQISDHDRTVMPHHISKAVQWFDKHVSKDEMDFDHEPTEFLEKVRATDGQGELLCTIGENLARILKGEIEPLELMREDNKLARHYEADVMNAELSKVMGDLVKNLSDLEPNLRVLEIGAGTAGTTLPILEAISQETKGGMLQDYTFTDISYGFFEDARVKLAQWSERVTYKKLDISQDPFEQGFSPEEFDIVIAANVLHATEDMLITMKNVRSLLRPKGRLLLLEGNVHKAMVLPFILLPGWWYATDKYRDHTEGPMMPVKIWDQLLRDTGFSGVDAAIHDSPREDHTMSIISSSRIGKQDDSVSITVTGPFLTEEEVEFAQTVSDLIKDRLSCDVDIVPFLDVEKDTSMHYVFIDSPNHSVWDEVSSDSFQKIQNLLVGNAGILWAIPANGSAESKFVKGVLRTLRIENEPKNLFVLDDLPQTPEGAAAIVKIAETLRDPDVTRVQDMDFVFHDGIIHVPRMRLRRELKEQFAVEQRVLYRKPQNIWNGNRAVEMTVDTAGSVDSIYFRRTNVLQDKLQNDEVMIKVEAAGVSHRDMSSVLGHIPWFAPGLDGAGTIADVGSNVSSFRKGDRVFFLSAAGGAMSTYKKVSALQVAKIPLNMSTTDAASIAMAHTLAVLALHHTARLSEGETILIHSAAGAVGQACVRLALHRKAIVFVTAGSQAKRDFLHETLNIPRERIFSNRTTHFRDEVLCATNWKGVDVVVNSVAGELLANSWSLMAEFGRFIELGKKDAFENTNLPMKAFDKGATFTPISLHLMAKHRPKELQAAFKEVVSLVQQGVIGPIGPVAVLPVSQFDAALRRLRSGDSMSKVVITLGPDEVVLAQSDLLPSKSPLQADGTYLITGGTKGIGLDLASWMVENGARNVVLLGRSGASGSAVQGLLKKYKDTGVNIKALACDVGSREQLEKVLGAIQDLPPIRGVIHSALLLSDKLFENATYEDWNIITGPRVKGAWNLHDLLPKSMDFFILLGSFLGDTGNGGQAIYAGTAVMYDALAKIRNDSGQHTVSIALPVVLDVGYVATNNLSTILQQSLGATLKMADIRTLIKSATSGIDSPFHSNGKAVAFKMYLNGQAVHDAPWSFVHPVVTKERMKLIASGANKKANSGAGGGAATSWRAAEDPVSGLTEALITKVSAMTMIERNEISSDAPVSALGLDSLVSVELRNWIRRETKVELPLSAITNAETLSALASTIYAQIDQS